MNGLELYESLKKITFNSDDASLDTLAGNIEIAQFMNNAIQHDNQEIAHYIAPTNYAYDSEEAMSDVAEHICKRIDKDTGNPINNHYDGDLNKPFIVIANTVTTLSGNGADTTTEGGHHWIGWVLLPKKYTAIDGTKIETAKHRVFFFDSMGWRKFPKDLKTKLTEGAAVQKTSDIAVELLSLCGNDEIEFVDCNDLTGQQNGVNGVDCGWWAVYYTLMTVYTGGVDFLNPIKDKHISALPLRRLINIQQEGEFMSQPNSGKTLPQPRAVSSGGVLDQAALIADKTYNFSIKEVFDNYFK